MMGLSFPTKSTPRYVVDGSAAELYTYVIQSVMLSFRCSCRIKLKFTKPRCTYLFPEHPNDDDDDDVDKRYSWNSFHSSSKIFSKTPCDRTV